MDINANDSYFPNLFSRELKFNSVDEFLSLQRKLLAKPIYLHVRLEKEKKSGNTRFITKGIQKKDFSVFCSGCCLTTVSIHIQEILLYSLILNIQLFNNNYLKASTKFTGSCVKEKKLLWRYYLSFHFCENKICSCNKNEINISI